MKQILFALTVLLLAPLAALHAANPIDIGSRRELMVDDYLVDALRGAATRRLHHPLRREIAVVHDAPWEGNGGGPGQATVRVGRREEEEAEVEVRRGAATPTAWNERLTF